MVEGIEDGRCDNAVGTAADVAKLAARKQLPNLVSLAASIGLVSCCKTVAACDMWFQDARSVFFVAKAVWGLCLHLVRPCALQCVK